MFLGFFSFAFLYVHWTVCFHVLGCLAPIPLPLFRFQVRHAAPSTALICFHCSSGHHPRASSPSQFSLSSGAGCPRSRGARCWIVGRPWDEAGSPCQSGLPPVRGWVHRVHGGGWVHRVHSICVFIYIMHCLIRFHMVRHVLVIVLLRGVFKCHCVTAAINLASMVLRGFVFIIVIRFIIMDHQVYGYNGHQWEVNRAIPARMFSNKLAFPREYNRAIPACLLPW